MPVRIALNPRPRRRSLGFYRRQENRNPDHIQALQRELVAVPAVKV